MPWLLSLLPLLVGIFCNIECLPRAEVQESIVLFQLIQTSAPVRHARAQRAPHLVSSVGLAQNADVFHAHGRLLGREYGISSVQVLGFSHSLNFFHLIESFSVALSHVF